jgi:hypothetical protein
LEPIKKDGDTSRKGTVTLTSAQFAGVAIANLRSGRKYFIPGKFVVIGVETVPGKMCVNGTLGCSSANF